MREYKLSLGAGESQTLTVKGNYFRVRETTYKVGVVAETAAGLVVVNATFDEGQGVRAPGEFYRLRITNDNAAAVSLLLIVGFGQYENDQAAGLVKVSEVQEPITVDSVTAKVGVGDNGSTLGASFYTRNDASTAINTVVAPSANINGVRVDAIHFTVGSGFEGYIAVCMATDVPADMLQEYQLKAFAYSGSTKGIRCSDSRHFPFIVPPGYGIFEQQNDSVTAARVWVNYEVI